MGAIGQLITAVLAGLQSPVEARRAKVRLGLVRDVTQALGLRSARAQEAAYTLCVLDIDQFRIINDSCGHGAGDALLGQVGSLLKSKIRWRDTLSRLGADEFGVLFESCGLDEANGKKFK
jgi:diguanylate cyclase (GGDEF)-like protein